MRLISQLEYEQLLYPTTMEEGAELEPPYPSVAKAGCGLCCVCMLAELLAGETLTVEECIQLSIRTGANRFGTDMGRLAPAAAERYGLELTTGSDIAALRDCLRSGGAAIVHVGRPGGALSDGGHFLLAVKAERGLIWLADPSFSREKYEKPCRRDLVSLEQGYVVISEEGLLREARSRTPSFYYFKRKENGNMKKVATDKAPAAIGPYGQAMVCGGTVYTSGQIPLDPATGAVVEGGIEAQSRRALENLKAVLEAAGSGLEHVAKTTCFLSDMKDFAAFNQVYAGYFPQCPARSCVAVRELPKQVLVEVEAVALVAEP